MKHIEQKLEVEYPCRWLYKLICNKEEALLAAVREIMQDAEHTLTFSKSSSKGKYLSFNLEVMVHTEEARNFFYTALKQHPSIKMVL